MPAVTATISNAGLANLGRQRVRNQVGRPSIASVGALYRAKFLPLKFRNLAIRRYPAFTPRKGMAGSGVAFKGSSTEQKLRAVGHTRPLEHSGESKQRTLGDKRVVAIAKSFTRYRADLPINAPTLNLRNPHSRINMRAEIEDVAVVEIPELNKAWLTAWSRRLARLAASNNRTLKFSAA